MKNNLRVHFLHGIISLKGMNEQRSKSKSKTKQSKGYEKHIDKRYSIHLKGTKKR